MIKLPEPLGYLCDWGDDRYGLPNQIVYYGGPGSAIEDGWSEHPEVHLNTPIHTESQLKQVVRDAYEDVLGIDWFELMRNNFDKERSEHIAESIETAIHALIKEIPE